MDAKKINIILDDFEKNSPKLYYHSERVAMIAYAFAQELNLSYYEREIAYFCGLLHDIGKFYLDEVNVETDDENLNCLINGSMVYFDKDFSKIMPVLNNRNIMDECDEYDYNVNIIKLIINLADEYDNIRLDNVSHEKACEVLRNKFHKNNSMITVLLKTIIKNKLNIEY